MTKTIKVLFVAGLLIFTGVLGARAEGNGRAHDRGPLDKITFIHYRRGAAKPDGVGGGGKAQCYGFLARGARWKVTEPFMVNATGSLLNDADVFNTLSTSANVWDTQVTFDVFGGRSLDNSAVYQTDTADNSNVVAFGPYGDSSVIAVTTVWGYFYGPSSTRELVEWDMLFNTHYDWSLNGEPDKMDLMNIAVHELGHSAGLADLYNSGCSLETMFGYASEGDTNKRDLNTGDILGIKELYK